MAQKDPLNVARGKIAASGPNCIRPNPALLREGQQELAVHKILRFARVTLADAPGLTADQSRFLLVSLTDVVNSRG